MFSKWKKEKLIKKITENGEKILYLDKLEKESVEELQRISEEREFFYGIYQLHLKVNELKDADKYLMKTISNIEKMKSLQEKIFNYQLEMNDLAKEILKLEKKLYF